MPKREYGLKTGDLPEEEMIKTFERALNKTAKMSSDLRISKGRKKLRKYTGPFGRSTPDAEPPEYDHIYFFSHRYCSLFLELHPNRELNGRTQFPDEGVIWNLHVTIIEDSLEGFGNRFIQELFQTLPGEKVLIKEYAMGEEWL